MSKIKTPLLVLALFAVGGGVALVLVRPEPENPLDVAVNAYADGLEAEVMSIEIHDTIADIRVKPKGQHLFVSFKKDAKGQWVLDKNLVEDFFAFVDDPAQEQVIVERFGKRMAQRFRMKIDIKQKFPVSRLVEGDHLGVAGRYILAYTLPGPKGKPPLSGRYIETYRYKDGSWTVEGVGRIMEHLFQAPPKSR